MEIQKELIAEYDRESASTRKTLEAIPENADFAWRPHAKSMTLGRLAAHVSDTTGDWATHTLTRDRLEWTPDMNPKDPANKKDLLARFGSEARAGRNDAGRMGFKLEVCCWRSDLDRRHQVQRMADVGRKSSHPSSCATWRIPPSARSEGAGHVRPFSG
jgi:hypothetical protein